MLLAGGGVEADVPAAKRRAAQTRNRAQDPRNISSVYTLVQDPLKIAP
jgi:hypothetical protein